MKTKHRPVKQEPRGDKDVTDMKKKLYVPYIFSQDNNAMLTLALA